MTYHLPCLLLILKTTTSFIHDFCFLVFVTIVWIMVNIHSVNYMKNISLFCDNRISMLLAYCLYLSLSHCGLEGIRSSFLEPRVET